MYRSELIRFWGQSIAASVPIALTGAWILDSWAFEWAIALFLIALATTLGARQRTLARIPKKYSDRVADDNHFDRSLQLWATFGDRERATIIRRSVWAARRNTALGVVRGVVSTVFDIPFDDMAD
ncbi:hypothetical protein GCM10022415_34030 [Knoellia locipacati]|uniref:Uncharacterized protein n=1 Tax=Knoellia locipacati TaxID=882824 RepID=A0A512T5A5_9MICO|nr:hypothetical protein [Knoellia locipacati]GEQ15349.1 hypothetical protein KLO01_33960 [Knoellia locipacati]